MTTATRRWTARLRVAAIATVLAMMLAACGGGTDDDAGASDGGAETTDEMTDEMSEPDDEMTDEEDAAGTSQPADGEEPPEEPMAMTGDEVLAEVGLPVPAGATFTEVRDTENGPVYGAWVDSAPPPDYASLVGGDWEVLEVRFGSEATMLWNGTISLCYIVYANYESPSAAAFWVWWGQVDAASRDACAAQIGAWIDFAAALGAPLPG